ncbi:MAG: hypothetical protein WEB00_04795 [Dehalococcoidia bacterium]
MIPVLAPDATSVPKAASIRASLMVMLAMTTAMVGAHFKDRESALHSEVVVDVP